MHNHTPISGQQTSLFTGDNVISSQEDSLVNPIAPPGNDSVKTMSATSGRRCLELFGRFPRATSWAKTFAALLVGMEVWYSTRCRLIWKLRASKCSRFYFQLQASTLHIDETESGLLPTPKVASGTYQRDQKTGKKKLTLRGMVAKGLLPTPQVFNATASFIKRKNYNGKNSHSEKLGNAIERHLEISGEISQLNPQFVLEMMGFPSNWTELPFQNGAKNPSKEPETP